MDPQIALIRENLLSTPDSVCLERARLVTEAYQRFAAEPIPLKRARALRHVLENMSLDLDSNPFFAGNTSARTRAWMLLPEYGLEMDRQVLLENRGLEGLLDGKIPPDLLNYWQGRQFGGPYGLGHLAVNLRLVVQQGLLALAQRARLPFPGETEQQRIYRQAMVIALEAVMAWAERYAHAAAEAAQKATDPQVRACHLRVAQACQRVPAYPARTLFEGLQAIVLVHFAITIEGHGVSVSIGLPDRLLEPLIEEPFDPQETTNLLAAFLLKIASNSVSGRGSKTQAITIGGLDYLGHDRCNALTECFLAACNQVRLGDPHLFLRWHTAMSPQVRQSAVELLAGGLSMPLLVHDQPTAQGFIAAGVSPEDAWNYCVIGCNELGIPGLSAESATATAGSVDYLDLLNQVIHQQATEIQDMPTLLAALEERMLAAASAARARGKARRRQMAEEVPTPFTSALMDGCIERGEDLHTGMRYTLPGIYERGLTNAVNALAAIQQVVFDQRAVSLPALAEQMAANFPDESLRQRLMAAPRWGKEDLRADRWADTLVAMRERVLDQVDAAFQQPPHMSCHVVRSLHHLDGARIGASPDGRRAGEPLADSIGAHGVPPTSMLNSVLTLNAANFRGGYNLNLTLPHSAAQPEVLGALVDSFFKRGGQELQVNVIDSATLRAAMAEPARYGDLVVRVAGFSARFVDLSPLEQAELLARAEAQS